jgi:hypothetical protein
MMMFTHMHFLTRKLGVESLRIEREYLRISGQATPGNLFNIRIFSVLTLIHETGDLTL